jgi:hypothetical protein
MKAAFYTHAWSDIEQMVLDKRERQKNGNKIVFTDIYSIRMRGKIVGTNIFKLQVTATSEISMDSKTVVAMGNPKVEE